MSLKNKAKKKAQSLTSRILHWCYASIVTLITGLFIGLMVGGVLCQWVSPVRLHYLQYLGIGFGISVVLAAVWMLLLVILRRWINVGMMAVTFLLLYGPITRYFPMHCFGGPNPIVTADGSIDTLRVFTYNTLGMGDINLNKASTPVPVIDVIRKSGADIVCLQEFAFSNRAGAHTKEELANRLRKEYPYFDFTPANGRSIYGIAFFSRYPIRHAERMDKRKKGYYSGMYYHIELPNHQFIAVANVHLCSNHIAKADRELAQSMNEHFDVDSLPRVRQGLLRSLANGCRHRASESQRIEAFLQENHPKRMPLILCGDMNDTPISYCYHKMRGDLEDAWVDAGIGPGITYNRHSFLFRIDHILHSTHLRTLDADILNQYDYSDHYPVTALFQILPD